MFNEHQVEQIPTSLGLSYKWERPQNGASYIIVEDKIKFIPFSNWVTDIRTGEIFHNSSKFFKLCEELAQSK